MAGLPQIAAALEPAHHGHIFPRSRAAGWLADEVSDLNAIIELPEIDTSLPMAELYLDLTFDAA